MRSAIYEGQVIHSRNAPIKHLFRFDLCYFYLDLDELDGVFDSNLLFSSQRMALARFRYDEHLKHANVQDKTSLRTAILKVLKERDIEAEVGSICLLTQLRYFGFSMNPINLYFCHNAENSRVIAIVVEVNNTPWGEQHLYVVAPSVDSFDLNESEQRIIANGIQKVFHVSPFMPLQMTYDFRFEIQPENLVVAIDNYQNGENPFNVSMNLARKPITSARMNLSLLKYPLISWRTFAAIYWQAAKLWWKKAPFYPHPNRQNETTETTEHQLDAKADEFESVATNDKKEQTLVNR